MHPGRRAGHAPALRQRHARHPLQRQLRRPDRRHYLDLRDPQLGSRASSRRATNAAFRASRSIPTSTAAARPDSASSTPTPTPAIRPLPGGLHSRRRQQHARHGPARMDREDPSAATYDGGRSARVASLRAAVRQPQRRAYHRSTRSPSTRDADFGLLYVGVADGGSGGDPLNLAQNLNSAFGKILRIDPLGENSANGKYGIPASNPFVNDNKDRHARRDLRLRRTQPSAPLLGYEDRARCSSPTSGRTSSKRSAL